MRPEDRRRLSRLLSNLADATVAEALGMVQAGDCARCRRVGVTGPPGAGKSSLIAKLARHRLREDGDLAIIAIDPTSPVSGGAILGDRIRMEELATDPRIYIRSLATRNSVDGLADNLPDILAALDGFGFSEVLLETVGVGQVEYAVSSVVDTTLVLLPPGAGDQVQAMKSGILEMADIYVINKADQPGAKQLGADLRIVLKQRRTPETGWTPTIIPTSTGDAASVAALDQEIDRHQGWLRDSGRWADRRGAWRTNHVASLLSRRIGEVLDGLTPQERTRPVGTLYATVLHRIQEQAS